MLVSRFPSTTSVCLRHSFRYDISRLQKLSIEFPNFTYRRKLYVKIHVYMKISGLSQLLTRTTDDAFGSSMKHAVYNLISEDLVGLYSRISLEHHGYTF
jgi:hypothetical protein